METFPTINKRIGDIKCVVSSPHHKAEWASGDLEGLPVSYHVQMFWFSCFGYTTPTLLRQGKKPAGYY
eukprot:scaffold252814_cov15-Tisochrysis_lutea.AAC.1